MIDPRKAAEELARRQREQDRASVTIEGIRAELFSHQINFIDDPALRKGALCTRRAGKTSMWSRYCTMVALRNPKCIIRVWGISRTRTQELLWNEFLDVFQRHKIEFKPNATRLTIVFNNGAEIRLLGADKDKEAQKKRGDKTVMEVILEAQLFGPHLKKLVEDVAEPCLMDHDGVMCLEGTPGPVPTGYWYWVSGDDNAPVTGRWESQGRLVSTGARNEVGEDEREMVGAGWSMHRWSVLDNPFFKDAQRKIDRVLKQRRWSIDTPTFVREYRGHWVKDDGALFYKFNEGRNTFTLAERQPWGPGWQHVLGWDLGFRDDMALVAWGWHSSEKTLYEAASWNAPGATADDVMAQIQKWESLGFKFIAKVADTGGGGRMYVEDVMSRFSQVFEAAQKSAKIEHARLMNDDFLSGRIKVQRGGAYAVELAALPKDPDWDPDSGKPPGEDPRFSNHLCDAGLYSWRKALNYLDFEKAETPETPDERAEREDEERFAETKQSREWWEDETNGFD